MASIEPSFDAQVVSNRPGLTSLAVVDNAGTNVELCAVSPTSGLECWIVVRNRPTPDLTLRRDHLEPESVVGQARTLCTIQRGRRALYCSGAVLRAIATGATRDAGDEAFATAQRIDGVL